MRAYTVSVIIPYYKKVTTIHRAVESVIVQTHTSWELIIVDDASAQVLQMDDSWQNAGVTLIRNDQNKGPNPSRDIGLSLANGQYLEFIGELDWFASVFLERALAVLEKMKIPEFHERSQNFLEEITSL